MIKEYIIKKLIDAAIDKAKKLLRESDTQFLPSREDIEESIRFHLDYVENWSSEVSFKELTKAKNIASVFIELDLFIYPRRISLPGEAINNIPLRTIFDYSPNHPILFGQPGAGKTTSMKYLCQLLLHNETFNAERFSFPILINFRELSKSRKTDSESIIIDEIFDILGLKITLSEKIREKDYATEQSRVKEKLVIHVLEEFRVLLILEGFDELGDSKLNNGVISEIRKLAIHLNNSRMIVTSRSGEFVYSIDNTTQYEISPLKEDQIKQFAIKWLQDEQIASEFLLKVHGSPFADTAIRPLTLAYLCAIYERVGRIPDKPKSIYKRVINLLLEEWDQQRSVRRTSRYANFEIDRKFDFLSRLAYVLTISLRGTVFTEDELHIAYLDIFQYYDLVRHEALQVVAELETHSGLILQTGYHRYEFAHKSLQEYLTAEFMVKLPSIPLDEAILQTLPNELAIAVTISSSPSDYFSELVLKRFKTLNLSKEFCKTFISRLLLEKPDFRSTFNVCLSLVLLYSFYIESITSSSEFSTLNFADNTLVGFEILIQPILNNNVSLVLENYYEIDKTYTLADRKIFHLSRKAVYDSGLAARVEQYPRQLYVSELFFDSPGSSKLLSSDA